MPVDGEDGDSLPLPRGMAALGWSGILPFAAALAAAVLRPEWQDAARAAFVGYGAVILSFLGGARWGHGLAAEAPPRRYVEAVLPSLVGFAALLALPWPGVALGLLAAGFAVWLLVDLADPLWTRAYRRMRLGVSLAVLALHAAWAAV